MVEMMTFCDFCGKPFEAGKKVCKHCGGKAKKK